MRPSEVRLNGKKLCLAGIGDDGVLSAIVNWVTRAGKGDLFLEVGGLLSPKEEHVDWIRQKPLKVGDEIRVAILETDVVDKPRHKHRIHPAERLKSKKRYVRLMANELGWKIQVQPKLSKRPKK